jgi:hypothetical protein
VALARHPPGLVRLSGSFFLAFVSLTFFPAAASADLRVFEANVPEEAPDDVPRIVDSDPTVPREEVAPTPPAPSPDAGATPPSGEPTTGEPATGDPATGEPTTLEPSVAAPEGSVPASAGAPPTTPEPAASTEPRPLLDDHRWLDITGFLQPGFIARLDDVADPLHAAVTDDTFWLQRARLGFRAQLFTWLRMRVELELSPTPTLQDGYVDIVPHPAIGLRIGQFIVPFLQTFRFNELNLAFLDRAIYVPQSQDRSFIRDLSPRDIGMSLSGRIGDLSPESHLPVLAYDVGMFIGRGANVPTNDDDVFLFAGRLQLHALGLPEGVERQNDLARNSFPRAAVGFGAYSNCDDRANWGRGFTLDVEARWEGLFFEAAFVWLRRGARDGTFLGNTDPGCRGTPGTGGVTGMTYEFVSRGAHLQLQYVLPQLLTGAGLGIFDAMELELLFRNDPVFGGGPGGRDYAAPPNYTDSDNAPSRWRMTFGINYYPTGQNQLRLGINYQLNREYEDVVSVVGTVPAISNDIFWIQITAGL